MYILLGRGALVAFFHEKALLSSVSLFEEGGEAVCVPQFRTRCCQGTEENELGGSQTDLTDELERGFSFLRSSAANEGELLDYDDAISLTSSDPMARALLGSAQEE